MSNNKVLGFLKRTLEQKGVKILLGVALGALIGELYWEFIGCYNGTCPITSSQTKSVLFFAAIGAWFTFRR